MIGLRVTKIVQEINFEGVWGKRKSKYCFQRQSFTKYLRQTLVFMWNIEVRKDLIFFFFFSSFLLASRNFLFWEGDWLLRYNFMKFLDFADFFYFPKSVSLKSFGNSWGNSYIPCLLLIIVLQFNCGERKIW